MSPASLRRWSWVGGVYLLAQVLDMVTTMTGGGLEGIRSEEMRLSSPFWHLIYLKFSVTTIIIICLFALWNAMENILLKMIVEAGGYVILYTLLGRYLIQRIQIC